jgi:peptide/nickel transport system substrate-binding protein
VIVPAIYNSELVKKNATEKDPWGSNTPSRNRGQRRLSGRAMDRRHRGGAGAQRQMGGGPLPKVKRIVWRMVPSAGNRRALLERGDADISYDLPNKDFVELKSSGKLNIVSTPYSTASSTSA